MPATFCRLRGVVAIDSHLALAEVKAAFEFRREEQVAEVTPKKS